MNINWADDFAHHRPDDEVKKHFRPAWRTIMFSQAKQPLQPQHDRQRGGHQQQIIKVRMQERPRPMKMQVKKSCRMRMDYQPVESIGRDGNSEQPVLQITETIHKASNTHPVVIANRVLSNKIITRPCYPRRQVTPESFRAIRLHSERRRKCYRRGFSFRTRSKGVGKIRHPTKYL